LLRSVDFFAIRNFLHRSTWSWSRLWRSRHSWSQSSSPKFHSIETNRPPMTSPAKDVVIPRIYWGLGVWLKTSRIRFLFSSLDSFICSSKYFEISFSLLKIQSKIFHKRWCGALWTTGTWKTLKWKFSWISELVRDLCSCRGKQRLYQGFANHYRAVWTGKNHINNYLWIVLNPWLYKTVQYWLNLWRHQREYEIVFHWEIQLWLMGISVFLNARIQLYFGRFEFH